MKFHFLKRFKVLENESILQKLQHFSCQKIHFFYEKFRKIDQILQEFLNFFGKIILKISIFMIIYKAKEILCGFYYQVDKIYYFNLFFDEI